ncbi:hypothetical protein MAAFP003_3837, partial [Mycobacterium ahvazicum]
VVTVGALEIVDDLRAAQWMIERPHGFGENVGSLVPAVFDAYARVFHPAAIGGVTVSWADVARANHKLAHPQMQFNRLIGCASRYTPGYRARQSAVVDEAPSVGTLPADVAASLIRTLARHTAAVDHCWFAVWDGWGGIDLAFDDLPTFQLPGRAYYLARGPLTAAAQSVQSPSLGHQSANLWWPEDQAWCVATEIDLDSTYLGASEACIEQLLADSELEVARLDRTARVAADSDTLNPASEPPPA